MKSNHKVNRLVTVVACLVALTLTGCSGSSDKTKRVTAYISSDSVTYGSTAEVVKHVADTVVEIRTESVTTQWGMQYVVSGAGSGVIVAHDSDYETYYIVTNNHVIEGARQIKVSLRSGDSYSAELVASDVNGDIAVVSDRKSVV